MEVGHSFGSKLIGVVVITASGHNTWNNTCRVSLSLKSRRPNDKFLVGVRNPVISITLLSTIGMKWTTAKDWYSTRIIGQLRGRESADSILTILINKRTGRTIATGWDIVNSGFWWGTGILRAYVGTFWDDFDWPATDRRGWGYLLAAWSSGNRSNSNMFPAVLKWKA